MTNIIYELVAISRFDYSSYTISSLSCLCYHLIYKLTGKFTISYYLYHTRNKGVVLARIHSKHVLYY